MNVFTLTKGFRVAFGHFNDEEILQMQFEGWRVECGIELKFSMPPARKKQIGVNKNGIPVVQ